MTIPICRYYDIESQTWKSDECVAVFSNESMSKCLCAHFRISINSNDFELYTRYMVIIYSNMYNIMHGYVKSQIAKKRYVL